MLKNEEIRGAMTIQLGNEYQDYPEFAEGIRRAPDRGFRLTKAQTRIALKNALRYVPEELHAKLACRRFFLSVCNDKRKFFLWWSVPP